MLAQCCSGVLGAEQARRCNNGITSALKTSSCAGNSGGMMLKPSAAPSVNRSSIRSAICSGVPEVVKWPRAPAR